MNVNIFLPARTIIHIPEQIASSLRKYVSSSYDAVISSAPTSVRKDITSAPVITIAIFSCFMLGHLPYI